VSALRRRLFLASRWVAILIIAALGIEQFRSFYRTDTLCVFPIAFVTDGGSLYLTSDTYSWYTFASEDAADADEAGPGSLPWAAQRVPQAQWNSEMTLGVNAFFGDTSFLIKLPIAFVLPLPALYLLWWRARRPDFQRTHYLAARPAGTRCRRSCYGAAQSAASPSSAG
jgi:hypothetical protein